MAMIFYKLALQQVLLLQFLSKSSEGVTITPLKVAPVCAGESVEMTCATSEIFLRWNVTIGSNNQSVGDSFTRAVSSTSASDRIEPITVSSVTLHFSRISAQNHLPLTSRLLINPGVNNDLNGTVVNCMEVTTSKISTTTIIVLTDLEVSLRYHSERFESKGATVVVDWTDSNDYSQYASYNVSVFPHLAVFIIGNTSIQLVVPYNTYYNVSITPYTCGQHGITVSIGLNYTKCNYPIPGTQNVILNGYRDPAVEGTSILLQCRPGLLLTGPNMTECTDEGYWKPDPSEIQCQDTCGRTLHVIYHTVDGNIAVTSKEKSQMFDIALDCCAGLILNESNQTKCLENGRWESNFTQLKCKDNELIITIATLLSGLLVSSVVMFSIGCVCGYLFYRLSKNSVQNTTHLGIDVLPDNNEQGPEVKENVAYCSLYSTIR